MWKCEKFLSSLAPSLEYTYIFSMLVFCRYTVVYIIAPSILRPEIKYLSEALARAYKSHVREFFSVGIHLGVMRSPPPLTKKLATLLE